MRAGVVRPAHEGAPGGASGSSGPDPKRMKAEADNVPIDQLRTSFEAAGLDVPSEETELLAMAQKMAAASRWAYRTYSEASKSDDMSGSLGTVKGALTTVNVSCGRGLAEYLADGPIGGVFAVQEHR
eukprot:1056343-Pyramimonas_sp.AAC.1